MKYAYIVNDTAVDVVRVDPAGIFSQEYASLFVQVPDEVEIMWSRNGAGEWLAPAPSGPVVPDAVEPLQGLLAIDAFGMADAYETWATSTDRTFAERAFINRAQTWRRNDPILQGASTALGLTSEQLDALFIKAATL